MIKKFLAALTSAMCTLGFAQIKFEKGYFITNGGERKQVFIQNTDWIENPVSFKYRTTEDEDPKTQTIQNVREFGLENGVRFIKHAVLIDRSSDVLNSAMSSVRNPSFTVETLFLKSLIEGKADLYLYESGDLRRFFFNVDDGPVEQLVYKKFQTDSRHIATNNDFRYQLKKEMQCTTLSGSETDRLKYRSTDLYGFFLKYNQCSDPEYVHQKTYMKRNGKFNLAVRPRVNYASLSLSNAATNRFDTDFQKQFTFGAGIEAEYVFPFNNNKWAVTVEPTYQYYKADTVVIRNAGTGYDTHNARSVEYNSVEMHFGLRHYMFLNTDSKMFINATFAMELPLGDSIIRLEETITQPLKTSLPVTLGVGYKYRDRYSAEFRYYTPRSITAGGWLTDYHTVSFILGYHLF